MKDHRVGRASIRTALIFALALYGSAAMAMVAKGWWDRTPAGLIERWTRNHIGVELVDLSFPEQSRGVAAFVSPGPMPAHFQSSSETKTNCSGSARWEAPKVVCIEVTPFFFR